MLRAHALSVVLLAVAVLPACAGPPRTATTFLDSVDLVNMTDQMARSFGQDEVLSSRTEKDESWVISVNRIVNFTNEIIPDREKWLYVARLRAQLLQADFTDRHNLIWIMPPQRWSMVQEDLGAMPPVLRTPPTHQLTGEFHAMTNTSGRGRTDSYLCTFVLFDLHGGTEIWRDSWEVKKAISGRTYD